MTIGDLVWQVCDHYSECTPECPFFLMTTDNDLIRCPYASHTMGIMEAWDYITTLLDLGYTPYRKRY